MQEKIMQKKINPDHTTYIKVVAGGAIKVV